MRPGLLGTLGLALILYGRGCDALAGQAPIDAHGSATSDPWQLTERHHLALAFLAHGTSMGIVVDWHS